MAEGGSKLQLTIEHRKLAECEISHRPVVEESRAQCEPTSIQDDIACVIVNTSHQATASALAGKCDDT